LVNNKQPLSRFDGYTDTEASNKKILRNVFNNGDTYFNSGDLLRRDWFGFFYWCDRVGDTFRWKGENVATTEVRYNPGAFPYFFQIEHVLASIPFISDVTVYGVDVPYCDGKAGMASIVLKDGFTESSIDWSRYHLECVSHLPAYARPLFIRIQNQLQTTGTFKHQKNTLVSENYNPQKMKSDGLYFYSSSIGNASPSSSIDQMTTAAPVIPLTQDIYEKIQAGKFKF
jgi:fatty-acyl-CoA synthase